MSSFADKNMMCPCGSGKKYRKCCKKKKQRSLGITVDMGKAVRAQIEVAPNGQIIMKDADREGERLNPVNANMTVSYERDNKAPKVLVDIPMNLSNLSFDMGYHLKNYDLIFAIDTNTKEIGNQKYSASAIVLCKLKQHAGRLEALYSPHHIFRFKNVELPEKIGWVNLIKGIMDNPQYSENLKVAIIVDSDYGNLAKYNSRELPIINNVYLPKNMTLIYASADSGAENLPNKLIYMCDKVAKETLEELNGISA